MATPEGRVKDKVKTLLKSFGDELYYFMPVQQGYGSPSLDFLGCYMGKPFAIETKAPGKKLTKRQRLTKSEMEDAGMEVFVIGEEKLEGKYPYSGMEWLDTWLKGVKQDRELFDV